MFPHRCNATPFDLTDVRQILALRPGAIGDTLLTFPALRTLRERFPGAGLTVVGNRPALELGRGAGLLDTADAFGADWVSDLFGDEPTDALKQCLERYDLAIVWLHTAEAARDLARMLRAAGVRAVLPALSFPAPGSRHHLAEHLRDELAPLGVAAASAEGRVLPPLPGGEGGGEGGVVPGDNVRGRIPSALTLTLFPRERESAECQLHQLASDRHAHGGTPLLVLHPGAGARYKRWPAERYAELAGRFAAEGCEVAVTAGPADEEAVEAFIRAARGIEARVLAGLRLDALAAELARASLVIGNDSGITHLAALVGAPTLALFGPYDPAYWRPIGPRVAVLDAGKDCPHRADPREGCRSCNLLDSLDVQSVWSLARRFA
ncbi:MAG TPA: glycosyltransferase family 9 protein [Chloroflexota bacterium]|nr:glycosyltransferase family 9 protein [Chloroflexota bacterium]